MGSFVTLRQNVHNGKWGRKAVLRESPNNFLSSFPPFRRHRKKEIQYSAKRWRLVGCVNSPRGQREPGRGNTQPSLHLLAEYCAESVRILREERDGKVVFFFDCGNERTRNGPPEGLFWSWLSTHAKKVGKYDLKSQSRDACQSRHLCISVYLSMAHGLLRDMRCHEN